MVAYVKCLANASTYVGTCHMKSEKQHDVGSILKFDEWMSGNNIYIQHRFVLVIMTKKLKILCLHGGGSNNDITMFQIIGLGLRSLAECELLHGKE